MNVRSIILDTIHQAVSAVIGDGAVELLAKNSPLTLEHPANPSHGDYASNVALQLFGQLSDQQKQQASQSEQTYQSPRALAEQLANYIQQQKTHQQNEAVIADVSVAGPGFINFTLSEHFLLEEMKQVMTKSDQLVEQTYQGKKVVVEFTDPNPFKQLHIGHLYSNTVGESISRLYEAAGAEVRRVDYFGDVGMHVAKSLWGMREKITHELELAVAEALEDLAEHPLTDRVKFLGQAYATGATAYKESQTAQAEIAQLNKLLYVISQDIMKEEHNWQPIIDYKQFLDPQTEQVWDYELVRKMYQYGKSWSLAYFESIYERVGMSFDDYYPESVVAEYGMKLVLEGLEKGIFTKSDGAIVFDGETSGLHTRVFINSNGLPTYEAKELGLAPAKYETQPYDLSVIITGNEINEYFKVLITAMKLLEPKMGERTVHLGHGMVRLPEGKMSSRTGKVMTAEWLLDEAAQRIWEQLEGSEKGFSDEERATIAEKVGQAAIKYAFLSSSIGRDIAFNFEESLSFQGDSGPYLQYTHVRCQSVLRKVAEQREAEGETGIDGTNAVNTELESNIIKQFDTLLNNKSQLQLTIEEKDILRHIYKYFDTLNSAIDEFAPHHLCTYLHQLAQKFNVFYTNCPIVSAKTLEQQQLRLALTVAVKTLLESGLLLLNIQTVERM